MPHLPGQSWQAEPRSRAARPPVMPEQSIVAGLICAAFVVVHIFGGGLRFLDGPPRSIWLSLAGGISVAYVFVHLLPELAEHQERFEARTGRGLLAELEQQGWLIALFGLSLFYGLERFARRRTRVTGGEEAAVPAFWLHVGSFALYNLLIGYLLIHREEQDLRGLLVYGFAMALHFFVNDHALHVHHGRLYHRSGRWLLAAMPVAGFGLGLGLRVSPLLVSALFAFLAGGVVLNVLKEELPADRESRFWAFATGAGGYAALLLATG